MSELPISRPVTVASVPSGGLEVDVVATEAERIAIAALNDVLSVDAFEAHLTVRPFGRDGLAVSGPLKAAATRTCVVSLEPFVETISDRIDVRFAPGVDSAPADEDAIDDPPDPLVGGVVDLGTVASEFFTLALDPYPRKPGAVFEKSGDDEGETSPFAALKALKNRAHGGE